MGELTDYLNVETLQQLQDAFTAVSQVPIRICDSSAEPVTEASATPAVRETPDERPLAGADPSRTSVPVAIDDETVGYVALDESFVNSGRPVYPRHLKLLGLITGVISRLCERESQLRTRLDDLATLYRLTGEFTGQRDLDALLNKVAATVVTAMNAKGCSIRLLSPDCTELVMAAVANLSPEYLSKGRILLAQSAIDREALSTGKTVYIADERSDPRVLYQDEARREGIVSALCAPMIYKGHPEGVIRVYTSERHEFNRYEVALLKAIAAQAAAAIVNARLHAEAQQSIDIQRQLRLAGEVQRRMIPEAPPKVEGLDLAAIYVPCFQLGGDFYDFLPLGPDSLGLAICDVVGKGVRASLLMASIRASLRAHASSIYEMPEVLARVNRDLCIDTLVSDFATLFYGVIHLPTRRLTYVNAGHTPPLLIRNGQVCHLSTGGSVLGIEESLEWRQESFTLEDDDVMLAYTDGLNEAMNFLDEHFGHERVQEAALEAISLRRSAEGIAKHVLWQMRRFAGLQTRPDDLTLVAIRVQ